MSFFGSTSARRNLEFEWRRADAARIFRMVMQQGAWQLVIGLCLARVRGVAARVSAAAALKNICSRSTRSTPHLFAVAGLLTLVAAVPVLFLRAAPHVFDPIQALRTE